MTRARDDWKPSGFFALRSPILPLNTLTRLETTLDATSADDAAALDAVLARDRDAAERALRELAREPVIREALFIASPSLDEAVDAWLCDAHHPRAVGVAEIVLRYVVRMSARSTPFGLFSGCSVGALGDRTHIELAAREAYRRHSRLDTHYLDALASALLEDPSIRHAVHMRPSTGAFATPTHYRVAESRADTLTRAREYRLVSVERTSYLDATLMRAAGGATIEELARALTDADAEISFEQALAYVDEVVASQLLAPDLAPAVTGAEALGPIVDTLRKISLGRAEAEVLDDTRARLAAIDADGLGHSPSRYRDIAASLQRLPARADLAKLFQVDLYKPVVQATLGPVVQREIKRAIEVLARLSPAREHDDLHRFREAFVERFETREVPLVLALDEELGVGFSGAAGAEPSPLLENLPFAADTPPQAAEVGPRERRLARALDAAIRSGAVEWSLTEEDLAALAPKAPATLPDAFAFTGTIAASRPDAADRGELRLHVHGVSGPSGATLLGRFCHGDAALRAHVIAHLREEEALRPDVIFAEIVHLPGGRLGNILGRPMLREYEIVYLASGGADEAHQIRIDDLLVSVRGTRVMLRSRRLDREIVPRMTTAHNYSGAALGIYRFLCALQTQDGASLGFSWGLLEHAPFLPRVRSGRAVLCPATWTLAKTDLAPLARGSLAARYAAARALRERLRIPRWAGLRDGDNVLPIDFEQPLYLDAIASMLKSRDTVQLVEITISASEACACGPEGSFAHEIVVPFVRTSSRGASTVRAADARFSARTFAPGSEWLYAKIYTGTAAAEAVLRDAIAPLRAQWAPQTWFFIRYSDPHSHLRVRFRGDPARLAGEILPALHEALAPMLADGRVWRLQLDTYAREVERYGGPVGVELAEELFAADSDAALAIALALRDDHGNQRRCDLALYGAHRLLCDLGLDLAARLALVRTAREAFAREHAVTRDFERHLGLKFRQRRAVIEELLGRGVDDNTGAAFEMRGVRVQQISVKLRSEIAAGAIMLPVDDLAASFVHMHINRMLRADHRAQELVIYDMLERVYDAKFARARRGGAGD